MPDEGRTAVFGQGGEKTPEDLAEDAGKAVASLQREYGLMDDPDINAELNYVVGNELLPPADKLTKLKALEQTIRTRKATEVRALHDG
jgi:hypothetical protein